MEPQPFVSCVCVTGKEPERLKRFLPVAIKCFHDQDYPADRRELIIVTDACFDLILPAGNGVRVQSIREKAQIRAEGKLNKKYLGWEPEIKTDKWSIGALRNFGLDAAFGRVQDWEIHQQVHPSRDGGYEPLRADLVTQWDDDDWYRQDRISSQVEVWKQNREGPVLLQYQLCYDFGSDTAAVRFFDNTSIHGSILHPKTRLRYPCFSKEEPQVEDTVFLGKWLSQAIMANDPAMYVRFAHGSSTWDAQHTLRHFGNRWALGQWHLGDRHRVHLQSVLAEYGVTHPRPTAPVTNAVPELVEQG